jgi:hypothetical protein
MVSRSQDGLRCARMSFQMGQRTINGLVSMEQTSYPEVLTPKHYLVSSSFVVPETVLKLLESFFRYLSNGCRCMQVKCGSVSFHIDSDKTIYGLSAFQVMLILTLEHIKYNNYNVWANIRLSILT